MKTPYYDENPHIILEICTCSGKGEIKGVRSLLDIIHFARYMFSADLPNVSKLSLINQ